MPLLESIISLITPHTCLHCEAEGSLLCASCLTTEVPAVTPFCFRCRKNSDQIALCTACQEQSPLQSVWAATDYRGRAKELVHQLKFQRAQAAIMPMATIISRRLPHLEAHTLVVPVPTATKRMRQRGYDQAVLLARGIAQNKKLQMRRLVKRTGQKRQVGANRQQRLRQLQDAFYVTSSHLPQRVLLVDDILTTGATLESAARVLTRAGVKHIDAVVFAQKV